MLPLKSEMFRLDVEFRAVLKDSWLSDSGISDQVIRSLMKSPDQEPTWAGVFTPLTSLYPQLQCEGFSEIPEALVLRANVAHMCFLVHTFLEDRFFDGQLSMNTEHVLFIKLMLNKGLATLEELGANTVATNTNACMETHAYSQTHGYHAVADTGTSGLRRCPSMTIAAGRAAFGMIATKALLDTYSVDEQKIRSVENAYDCLVTGMQWLDDLQDWQEDLSVEDENLLLVTLQSTGLDAYAHANTEFRLPNVAYALLTNGIFALACERARRWLEAAARREKKLSCTQLLDLIEKRIELIPKFYTDAAIPAQAIVDQKLAEAAF